MTTTPDLTNFRPPSSSPLHALSTTTLPPFTPPPLSLIEGTWRVARSTLPMWKSSRNVTITYTPHATLSGAWDNLVKYQTLTGDKWKTVSGVEKPDPDLAPKQEGHAPFAWNWRGKGMLMIASSHWEILGHGQHAGVQWCCTWFEKTLFTPAGVDLLVKGEKIAVDEVLVESIKGKLRDLEVEDGKGGKCADMLFEVKFDA